MNTPPCTHKHAPHTHTHTHLNEIMDNLKRKVEPAEQILQKGPAGQTRTEHGMDVWGGYTYYAGMHQSLNMKLIEIKKFMNSNRLFKSMNWASDRWSIKFVGVTANSTKPYFFYATVIQLEGGTTIGLKHGAHTKFKHGCHRLNQGCMGVSMVSGIMNVTKKMKHYSAKPLAQFASLCSISSIMITNSGYSHK